MNDAPDKNVPDQRLSFLAGGGATGDLMRKKCWQGSVLGDPIGWPQSLKTLVELMLASDHPMFVAWGREQTLLYNDTYVPMLADRHPGALGKPFFDVWPEIRESVGTLFQRVSTGESIHMDDIELYLDRPNRPREAHFAFSYTPVRDDTGAIVGLFCACNETTETVLAERARQVAEASERNRLWTLSEDMLARANFGGQMSAVNPAWTSVLGWSEAHLLSTPYADFMHPDDAQVSLDAIAEMQQTNQPTRFENRIAAADGRWVPIGWSVSPEPDDVNFIAVGRDLTADKAREAELELTHEALRQSQKLETMGQLTGGVAHDFNNLLTPIIGSLDTLIRRNVGTERERRLIDGALQSADRAKTLVQRLLSFARRQPLQPVAVDLAEMVANLGDLISSTLGPGVKVRVSVEDGLPHAKADRNQIEMAILNLSVNARDAMPDGGELTISARHEVFGVDDSGEVPAGDYVSLAVADTGMGMDEETKTRAIEPFFSTKGIGKGTGLGLSMAHGLAAQLGGTMTIESSEGQGTEVKLWLPTSNDLATEAILRPATKNSPADGVSVLLVDDELLIRFSTSDMLKDLGYDVTEAGSAEEAIELINAGLVPDILVTDHLMPGMTGEALITYLRKRWPELRALIVSGYSENEGIPSDIPNLTKPFRSADILAKLEAIQGD